MAKETRVFKVGVNIVEKDGSESRYEAGDKVPELTKEQEKALKELDAIEVK